MKDNRFLCLLPCLCLVLCTHVSAQGLSSLVPTEIMVANVDQVMDPSWNYGAWLEVYNSGTTPVSLRNCHISDNAACPKQHKITANIVVRPKGYTVLYFDHHDSYTPTQIDMKLDADGGTLFLSDVTGNIGMELTYPVAVPRASYARIEGCDEWTFTNRPTPGMANGNLQRIMERLPAPEVNKPSQVFTGILMPHVENIPEGATLRFTLDGSTPSMTNGQTSADGYFLVNKTQIMRFAFFREDRLMSPVTTRTYILKDRVFSLPIISVVTDDRHLYDETIGIMTRGTNGLVAYGYTEPMNFCWDWERPVNFELLTPNGVSCVNQEAEIRRCGAATRPCTPYSFKVHATKVYEGENTLNYPFFRDKPHLKHKALQIRGGGNDHRCRVKDAFLQQLVLSSGIDIDCQAYQPVVHYINGVFRGVINMREPSNKHFVYANWGLGEDEIDFFEVTDNYYQKCGTRDAFEQWYTLSSTAQRDDVYQQIRQLVDIDELCNYVAVQLYLANWDWPHNNMKAFRPRETGGRFRFILQDLDLVFNSAPPFQHFQSQQHWSYANLIGAPIVYTNREVEFVTIFLNMLRNADFRRHFIDAYCLVAGSVFEPTRCQDMIHEMVNRVIDMQTMDDNGYEANASPWPSANELIQKLTDRLPGFIAAMKQYAPMQLENTTPIQVKLSSDTPDAHLLVNGQDVPTGRFDGMLFPPVQLQAVAPMGYVFAGWTDGTGIISEDDVLQLPTRHVAQTITACFIREDDTSPHVVINEVSAANSIYVNDYYKRADWIELFNPTSKAIDLAGMYLSDDPAQPAKYRISSEGVKGLSTVIPAHGYRVIWCDGRTPKTELHAPFKLKNAYASVVLTGNGWADTLRYCPHDGKESIGRFPSGGHTLYNMTRPSIGQDNRMGSYCTVWDPSASTTSDVAIHRDGQVCLHAVQRQLLIQSDGEEELTLTVHDTAGKRFLRQSIPAGKGGKTAVSLTHLPPGLYVATLRSRAGRQCNIKLHI